jgi:hypothetical protein
MGDHTLDPGHKGHKVGQWTKSGLGKNDRGAGPSDESPVTPFFVPLAPTRRY